MQKVEEFFVEKRQILLSVGLCGQIFLHKVCLFCIFV